MGQVLRPVSGYQTNKHTVTPIVPFPTTERRFGHLYIDFVGPLSPSNGNKYLMTWVWLHVPTVHVTLSLSPWWANGQWFSRFDIPDGRTTDQGRQFEADMFRIVFCISDVRQSTHTYIGIQFAREREHRTLKDALTAATLSNDASNSTRIVNL